MEGSQGGLRMDVGEPLSRGHWASSAPLTTLPLPDPSQILLLLSPPPCRTPAITPVGLPGLLLSPRPCVFTLIPPQPVSCSSPPPPPRGLAGLSCSSEAPSLFTSAGAFPRALPPPKKTFRAHMTL